MAPTNIDIIAAIDLSSDSNDVADCIWIKLLEDRIGLRIA
jgi:hypothetical protein